MAKEKIPSMVTTHTAAGGQQRFCPVETIMNKGYNLLGDIPIVIFMAASPIGRMGLPVCPGLAVDAVDGEELNFALFDQGPCGMDHSKIFKFEKTAAHRWKYQDWLPRMPVDLQRHFLI